MQRKKGRDASGKILVFGLLKRGGKVFTKVISNVKSDTLISIIEQKVIRKVLYIVTHLSGINALDVRKFNGIPKESFELF